MQRYLNNLGRWLVRKSNLLAAAGVVLTFLSCLAYIASTLYGGGR